MVIVTTTYGDKEPQLPFSLGLQAESDTGDRCVCVYRVVNTYLCVCACVSSLVCTHVCTYVWGGQGLLLGIFLYGSKVSPWLLSTHTDVTWVCSQPVRKR